MLFMVIERFRDNDMLPAYQHLRDHGRSLPDGLEYVDSWIEPTFARCFQLMRCDDPRLFQQWVFAMARIGCNIRNRPRRAEQRNAGDRRPLSQSCARQDPQPGLIGKSSIAYQLRKSADFSAQWLRGGRDAPIR